MDLLKTFIFQTNFMSNILSYSSLTIVPINIASMFGGSSKYKVIDGELISTGDLKKEVRPNTRKPEQMKSDYDLLIHNFNEEETNIEIKPIEPEKVKQTVYKLKKTKIRRKCFALSRLEKSKKFLAFYSISFPVGLSDNDCYTVFNIWLTRCRKKGCLNTYLWVAERQKNGTIHFHLLTNDHMDIQTVNRFMAIALSTVKGKGVEALQNINPDKYNGVDVKRVQGTRKSLVSYLVKYISKNEIEFYRLPWHCSRDVSRLFTSMNFDDTDIEKIYEHLPEDPEQYNTFQLQYCTVQGFKFIPEEIVFTDLDGVNEIVYSTNN
jgi:hypothetical protein